MLLSLALSGSLAAQDTAAVAAGARLRVSVTGHARWEYGVFQRVAFDSLDVGARGGQVIRRYSLANVEAVEVYQRNDGLRNRHAVIGIFAGAIGSVAALYIGVQHCESTNHNSDGPPCAIGYAGLPIYLIAGAGAGGVLGTVWPVRHWRRAPLVQTLRPERGGA